MNKKKIYSLLLALLLLTVLVFIAGVPAFAADSKTYLALGDSISTGYRLADKSTQSFPALVKGMLGDEYTLVNKAVDGETTTSLWEHLSQKDYQDQIRTAELITVTIGGNDFMDAMYDYLAEEMDLEPKLTGEQVASALMRGDAAVMNAAAAVLEQGGFQPEDSFYDGVEERLHRNLSLIRSLNPDATLILATQYHPFATLASQIAMVQPYLAFLAPDYAAFGGAMVQLSEDIDRALETWNAIIAQGKTAYAYQVAEVNRAFSESEINLCNAGFSLDPIALDLDIHPNAQGHKVIADTVNAVLTQPHQHSYRYLAEENTVKETCTCGHSEFARIKIPAGELIYNGSTDFRSSILYSSGWVGGKSHKLTYLRDGITPESYTEGGDYQVSLTIQGQTATASYTVRAAATEITQVSDPGKTYDGLPVTAPAFTHPGKGEVTVEYKVMEAADSTYTTKAPKDVGCYTVRITVAADGSYQAAVATKDFTITQAIPVKQTLPTAPRILLGQPLSELLLTGGAVQGVDGQPLTGTFAWKDPAQVLHTPGEGKASAIFTPEDPNYTALEVEVALTVAVCDTPSGNHDFSLLQQNEKSHWYRCSVCSAEGEAVSHTYDAAGLCLCGAVKEPVKIPLVAGIAILALLIGGGVLLILRMKRR